MRKRIARKKAKEFAAVYTMAVVLDHARPSFWQDLPQNPTGLRKRAQLVKWAAKKNLTSARGGQRASLAYRRYCAGGGA